VKFADTVHRRRSCREAVFDLTGMINALFPAGRNGLWSSRPLDDHRRNQSNKRSPETPCSGRVEQENSDLPPAAACLAPILATCQVALRRVMHAGPGDVDVQRCRPDRLPATSRRCRFGVPWPSRDDADLGCSAPTPELGLGVKPRRFADFREQRHRGDDSDADQLVRVHQVGEQIRDLVSISSSWTLIAPTAPRVA
jgi:hypothetical protein